MMSKIFFITNVILLFLVGLYWGSTGPGSQNMPGQHGGSPKDGPKELIGRMETGLDKSRRENRLHPEARQEEPAGKSKHENAGYSKDVDEHFAGSVFHPDRNSRDYSSYQEAVLQSLADSGDVYAMKELAYRYIQQLGSEASSDDASLLKRIESLAADAVVYGDREMIAFLPEFAGGMDIGNPNLPEEKKYAGMINGLALGEFLGMRGDEGQKLIEQNKFLHVYMPEKKSLTPAEREDVKLRAREIYDFYEQKRIERGLGPFDNSVPEGVSGNQEEFINQYFEEIGDFVI